MEEAKVGRFYTLANFLCLFPSMEAITRKWVEDKHDKKMVNPKRAFLKRKWTTLDRRSAVGILFLHVLSLLAPFHYNWAAFWLLLHCILLQVS